MIFCSWLVSSSHCAIPSGTTPTRLDLQLEGILSRSPLCRLLHRTSAAHNAQTNWRDFETTASEPKFQHVIISDKFTKHHTMKQCQSLYKALGLRYVLRYTVDVSPDHAVVMLSGPKKGIHIQHSTRRAM